MDRSQRNISLLLTTVTLLQEENPGTKWHIEAAAALDKLAEQEPVKYEAKFGGQPEKAWTGCPAEAVDSLLDEGLEVRALYAAPVAQLVVPEGWQLVPKEPTDEMVLAGIGRRPSESAIYLAMLAAAPQPGGK